MKKIFTLLFCVTIVASAFAQRDDRDRNDRNQPSNNPYVKTYPTNGEYYRGGDRDERNEHLKNEAIAQHNLQIANINSDIDMRIQRISYDRFMSRRQKRKAIENLESMRIQQIQACNNQFNHGIYSRR